MLAFTQYLWVTEHQQTSPNSCVKLPFLRIISNPRTLYIYKQRLYWSVVIFHETIQLSLYTSWKYSTHYLLRLLESHNASSTAYNSLLNTISIGQFSLSIGRSSKKIMVKACCLNNDQTQLVIFYYDPPPPSSPTTRKFSHSLWKDLEELAHYSLHPRNILTCNNNRVWSTASNSFDSR